MTRNLGLKAFSVLIALILALFVHSESNSAVRTFVSPIQMMRIPTGKVVLSPLNPSAQVTVKGPSFIVSKIPNSPPSFSLSFPQGIENRYRVQLDPNLLALPPQVEVLNIDPQEVEFSLDSVVSRVIPVVVPRIGTVEDTMKISSFEVSPDKITASGPSTELNVLPAFETEPVDLRNLHESTNLVLTLRNVPQLTHLSVDRVSVAVELTPVMGEKRIEDVNLEVRAGPGARFQVEPASVDITVSGPKAALATFKRNDVVAYVRVADNATALDNVPVGVDLPSPLTVRSIDPENVKVVSLSALKPKAPERNVKGGRAHKGAER